MPENEKEQMDKNPILPGRRNLERWLPCRPYTGSRRWGRCTQAHDGAIPSQRGRCLTARLKRTFLLLEAFYFAGEVNHLVRYRMRTFRMF